MYTGRLYLPFDVVQARPIRGAERSFIALGFIVALLEALSGLNPWKAYGPDGVPFIVLKNCASVLTPCLVKLFCLCQPTSIFPSCGKYAHIQPVPKKGDRSNPSNYCSIALLSCLSKDFGTILNKWLLKHLSSFKLLSDRQYGFHKEHSTGDLLAFLTNS